MAVYTVHQPPLKKYEAGPDPERFAFVRDGFSFWAFVMWLVLLGYIVVAVAMQVGLRFVGASGSSAAFAGFMLALLVGIEAGTLRRFTLGRRRWRNLGTIVGGDRETVERRFFDSWVQGETIATMSPAMSAAVTRASSPAAPLPRSPAQAPDVIGLFPQPGTHR